MRIGSMRVGLTAEMDPYEHYLTIKQFWNGWDWKSYWLSAFATFKFDTFDDGYFPTRGFRFSVDGRYVFKGYSIDLDPVYVIPQFAADDLEIPPVTENGSVPVYGSALANFEAAFSLGSRFTLHPRLSMGWYNIRPEDTFVDNCLNPRHIVTIGGFMPNRYTERQIPFFGFANGFRNTRPLSVVFQLDLRYRFSRKNFVTARAGFFNDAYLIGDFANQSPFYAFGAEYARQTVIGPLKVAVQWSDLTGTTAYAGIGFDF